MKYYIKELLSSEKNLDDHVDLDVKECGTMQEVVELINSMTKKGFELKARKENKDYNKLNFVNLYFKPAKKKK